MGRNHGSDNTLQVRDKRLSVLRYVELHCLHLICFLASVGHEIEGVVATGGEQDRGAYLAVISHLSQSIGKMNELVDELEELWRVGH